MSMRMTRATGRVVDEAYRILTEVPEGLKVRTGRSTAGHKPGSQPPTNQVASCGSVDTNVGPRWDLLRIAVTGRGARVNGQALAGGQSFGGYRGVEVDPLAARRL
jgi:hypothetical protein